MFLQLNKMDISVNNLTNQQQNIEKNIQNAKSESDKINNESLNTQQKFEKELFNINQQHEQIQISEPFNEQQNLLLEQYEKQEQELQEQQLKQQELQNNHVRNLLALSSKALKKKGLKSPSMIKYVDANDMTQQKVSIDDHERPFMCQTCGKRFRQRCHIDQHMRTHTNDRPYHCSYCEKSFKQKSQIDQHERIHTGLKPYQCYMCARAYPQATQLRYHMKSHIDPNNSDFSKQTIVKETFARKRGRPLKLETKEIHSKEVISDTNLIPKRSKFGSKSEPVLKYDILSDENSLRIEKYRLLSIETTTNNLNIACSLPQFTTLSNNPDNIQTSFKNS